ncbi:hypothetical protein SCARR_02892 [Pontiella sulfatireligans]|uniref:Uncharacterized protein n=1 Tax=Pontiella sulfatireligans TaxID=2750658 RepID=A0A6C2UKR4_9BACT|nr:hypothetical protein SCARR_02892 [Pontiella sulfatireligans]
MRSLKGIASMPNLFIGRNLTVLIRIENLWGCAGEFNRPVLWPYGQ